MEPPFWYYPVRESLGAALLKTDQLAEAERAFREVLEHFPTSGRALFGLEATLRRQGKAAEAKKVQREFKNAWKRSDLVLDLAWF
jgi:Flp pilus assembly protein TadD